MGRLAEPEPKREANVITYPESTEMFRVSHDQGQCTLDDDIIGESGNDHQVRL